MEISFIFDMDGLILDTETIARKVWPICYDFISNEEADKDYLHIVGKSNAAIVSYLSEKYPGQPIEQINSRVDEEIINYVAKYGAGIKKGVLELFEFLDRHGIKKALATSSHRRVATTLLTKENLLERFDVIVCGNEIRHSKPHPEIFLTAASQMQTLPSSCYVCEDSFNGILAAAAGGMIPIMIPDQVMPTEEIARKAFRIYPCISDIIPLLKETCIESC